MQAMDAMEQDHLTNNKLLLSKIFELHQTISKLNTLNVDLRDTFIEKENEVSTITLFVCHLLFVDCFP